MSATAVTSRSPRIQAMFEAAKRENRTALVAYIAAGDPDFDRCLQVVDALVKGGVDMLELGVPFSDPLADGPTNQSAAQRALDAGMTVDKCLDLVRAIRAEHPNLPLVFYSYLNPIAFARNFATFCDTAAEAGLDALLPLDLTPGEDKELRGVLDDGGALSLVGLVAPTTPEDRLPVILDGASAFVYYICREGVTGERADFASGVTERVELIRSHSDKPVVVGFGIGSPEHAEQAAATGVDGVVVGSAIVKRVAAWNDGTATLDALESFVASLAKALRN